ncbi:hypothetical protein [Streptomyces sp. NPDC059168]|uniref:hypothetical protein n=1 Tax=Streptomyces sp. NPDC059168 TaxID=3346753 RepID=UPI003673B078
MDKRFTPVATDATGACDDEHADDEHDAAGGMVLKGRNRACARTRALAGMVLTSGVVITLSTIDTSVSVPH